MRDGLRSSRPRSSRPRSSRPRSSRPRSSRPRSSRSGLGLSRRGRERAAGVPVRVAEVLRRGGRSYLSRTPLASPVCRRARARCPRRRPRASARAAARTARTASRVLAGGGTEMGVGLALASALARDPSPVAHRRSAGSSVAVALLVGGCAAAGYLIQVYTPLCEGNRAHAHTSHKLLITHTHAHRHTAVRRDEPRGLIRATSSERGCL